MAQEYFNPLKWFSTNKKLSTSMPVGDLFENRIGYPDARVLLDTSPPVGDVIINENLATGGVMIHEFELFNGNTAVSNIKYYTQDAFDNSLAEIDASAFGSSSDESAYVQIGYRDIRSIMALIPAEQNISVVRVCANAISSKHYLVEARVKTDQTWLPVINLIASPETRDFFDYTFGAATNKIDAIRIKYKGDYYAASNSGNTLTVTAYDKLTTVSKLQVSHYSDFSDAADFTYNNVGDWVSVEDDTNVFDWDLVNDQKLWTVQGDISASAINYMFKLGNNIIALSNRTYYTISYSTIYGYGTMTSHGAGFEADITSAAIHENKLYVGLANGKIYVSYDGINYFASYTIITDTPIDSLASYSGYLYIGVSKSITESYLYRLINEEKVLVATLPAPSITALVSAKGYLFIGLSGNVNGVAYGYIYKYDGFSATLSFNTATTAVECLSYSSLTQQLLAGTIGGKIFAANFDSNNVVTWINSAYYESDATVFYNITTNNYTWICSDTEFISYLEDDTETWKFELISPPTSNTIKAVTAFGSDIFGAGTDGKIYKLDTSILGNSAKYVYVKLQDEAGNETSYDPTKDYKYISDYVVLGSKDNTTIDTATNGHIYQVSTDTKTVLSLFSPAGENGITSAPYKETRAIATHTSYPFYAPSLTSWDQLALVATIPATTPSSEDYGVEVDIYVRSANTRAELLLKQWNTPFTVGGLKTAYTPNIGVVPVLFDLSNITGKWIQFYAVLTSATSNTTPILSSVVLSYKSSGLSYFYTSLFDTEKQISNYYNYIANSDFEVNTSPLHAWTVAGAKTTFAQTTSDIISGTASALIHRVGAGVLDPDVDYVTSDFNIDIEHDLKTLLVTFDYKTKSGYVSGDISVSIINTSDATVLMDELLPASTDISHFVGRFTVDDATKNFTLRFALNSGVTFDCIIDNVYVGVDCSADYGVVSAGNVYPVEYGLLSIEAPKFRRGLLTANTTVTDGEIIFGYTTENSFDWNDGFTEIIPNTVFELPESSSKIRFGILLISVTDPVIVNDFAVKLEAHDTDMKFMTVPKI